MNVINGAFPATVPKAGTGLPGWIDGLPPETAAELARKKVLTTAQAAEFTNFSVGHFRRLEAAGKLPQPVRLGARKKGYRLGDLIDWQSRSIVASPAA